MSRITRPLSALAAFCLLAAGSTLASMPAAATGQVRPTTRLAPSSPLAPAVPNAGQAGEQWRPQTHYTPQKNWMNDPNGLVYYDGEYHMFYQYNPEGSDWGNMSWGHAVSKDLVHWQELGVAIPYTSQYGVFSGSAVIDTQNTSGLGSPDNPAMVAVWTRADVGGNQSQSLAYSTDKGRTWNLYNNGDPVLDIGSNEFRDPKVFWDETTGRWTMVVSHATEHRISFYSSPDLIHWTEQSSFGGEGITSAVWECPDFFPLQVDGDSKETKWVLVVTVADSAQYFVGSWDGSTFTPEEIPHYTGEEGTTLADFENGYTGWKADGAAFGSGPATGDLPGHQGKAYVDSFGSGDADTGTLTSDEFTVSSSYINLRTAGGKHPYNPEATGDNGGGKLLAGFDGSWDGWTVEGTAFGTTPPQGATPGQQPLVNHSSAGLLNTYFDVSNGQGSDATTGTATSPAFTIDSSYLNLLMGGGANPRPTGGADGGGGSGATVVELVVDGKVVRSATGRNLEELNWQSWDVSDLKGKSAQIVVTDTATGGWGHILLDEVRASDTKASPFADNTSVNLVVDGKVVASATGNNSGTLEWTSMDVSAYKGRKARLVIEDHNGNAEDWGHLMVDQIIQSNTKAFSGADVVPRLDYGKDYYAAVTWNDAPDGKRYQVGWMSNWVYVRNLPTTTWRTAMSTVRELGLTRVDGKLRLTAQPITALESLRTGQEVTRKDTDIPAGDTSLGQAAQGTSLDISVDLSPGTSSFAGLKVLDNGERYTLIGYDAEAKQLVVDRTHSGVTDFSPKFPDRATAPLSPDSKGQVHLRIVVDAHSVEVFAADGTPVITETVYPEQGAANVSLYAEGGTARLNSLSLWHLGAADDAGGAVESPDSPGPGQPAAQKPRHDQAEAQAASSSPVPAAAGKGKSGGFPLARTGTSLTLGVLGVLATTTGAYALHLRRRKA